MSAPKKSENRLLPKEVRERLQAVVVDANAYGPVGPDLANLAVLAEDLSEIGLEVWVPEPVAWEWAEHLANQWAAARAAAKAAEPLRKAGLLPVLRFEDHYKNRAAVIDAFLDRLGRTPHVEVIPLTGESAIEGLRDQVLLRPPAKTKADPPVKTGGSDSAWLRMVLAEVDGAADALLFLSSDGDIKQAYAAWGHQPPLLCRREEIRGSLFEYLPATAEEQWRIAESLVARMPIDLQASTSQEDSAVIDFDAGWLAAFQHHPDDGGITSSYVARLTALAGFHNIRRKQPEPGHEDLLDPDAHTFMGDVFFLAEAEAVRTVQDPFSSQAIATGTQSISGLLVRARMTLTIRNNTIETLRSDGDEVLSSDDRFGDAGDAWNAVDEVLSAVPGLKMPAKWFDWSSASTQPLKVAGRDQPVELNWSPGEWGTLSVGIDYEYAEVSCHYDETTWWGGKDGMHMEPPYYLSAESSLDSALDPAWELPAWIITQLTKQDDQTDT